MRHVVLDDFRCDKRGARGRGYQATLKSVQINETMKANYMTTLARSLQKTVDYVESQPIPTNPNSSDLTVKFDNINLCLFLTVLLISYCKKRGSTWAHRYVTSMRTVQYQDMGFGTVLFDHSPPS